MPRGRRRAERPVDESMSLLNQLLNNPLDAGYLEAASAEPAARPKRSLPAGILLGLLAVALGIVTVWGVRALRLPESADTRQSLEREAEQRGQDAEARRATVESLQAQLQQLRRTELPVTEVDPGVDLMSGTSAVTGPGLAISLDDAPAVKKDPVGSDPAQRVRDTDIQYVVNGLWAAGAEAIAVNGHRLTSLSAIRTAGSAIQVDLTSLQPPYVIEAIGSPDSLQQGLANTRAQDRLALLQANYGISVQQRSETRLSLPAAVVNRLSYAQPTAR